MERLPAAKVVLFLSKVIQKFEANPSRGQGLAKWIRAVLVQHTAHLMSVPGLVSQLSGLYQVRVVCRVWVVEGEGTVFFTVNNRIIAKF